jgi:hypothetical protein
VPSAARMSVRTQVFSPSGCPFVAGRLPNRTSCDPPIRRRGTPTLLPAILGLGRDAHACAWRRRSRGRFVRYLYPARETQTARAPSTGYAEALLSQTARFSHLHRGFALARAERRAGSRPSTWWNMLLGLRWPGLRRLWLEGAGFRWWVAG